MFYLSVCISRACNSWGQKRAFGNRNCRQMWVDWSQSAHTEWSHQEKNWTEHTHKSNGALVTQEALILALFTQLEPTLGIMGRGTKKKKKRKRKLQSNSYIHMAVSGGWQVNQYMARLLTYLVEVKFLLPLHSQVTWPHLAHTWKFRGHSD